MDKNKQLRVYEGGLFPLEIKIVIVIITILLKIKVSNFNNIIPFFVYICNERSHSVYQCISSEKFKTCVDIKANLNL